MSNMLIKTPPTHQGIKKKIIAFERQFEVDTWVVNGIDVWPYIRIKIYFLLLTNCTEKSNETIFQANIRKNINKPKIKNIFQLLGGVVFSFIKTKYFFLRLRRKKIIFFGSHIHRVKHENEYFNRFFDSMVSHHNLQKDVYMVEHQKVYQLNYNNQAIIPLEAVLLDYKLVDKLKSKLRKQKNSYTLSNYENFLSVLENDVVNAKSLNISTNDLLAWSLKIKKLAIFYKRLYLKVKPLKAIFPGYYAWDNLYAAVYAANKLKIKTVDFQHGTQSNVHMVFSSWTKIPEKGFNIMPKEYWSWDEKSKKNIDYWAKNTSSIITKVVGQPYLQYWIQKSKYVKHQNNVILCTLNLMPLSEMFNDAIATVINESEQLWEIRLHPRNEFSSGDIEVYLESLGVKRIKYSIHDAREVPLPQILSKTAIHITAFSGSLIEAKMMGIPSVIINTIGEEIFKDYIDNNLVYFLDQNSTSFAIDFLNLFKNLKDVKYNGENNVIINPILA
jgi:hypothetical protein